MSLLTRPWSASCDETEERLSDHLDGELSAWQERRVSRHLARCPRCGGLFESFTRAVGHVRALGREDAPAPSVVDTVTTSILTASTSQASGPRDAG